MLKLKFVMCKRSLKIWRIVTFAIMCYNYIDMYLLAT